MRVAKQGKRSWGFAAVLFLLLLIGRAYLLTATAGSDEAVEAAARGVL